MNRKGILLAGALLCAAGVVRAEVNWWEVTKSGAYEQTQDDSVPASAFGWFFTSYLETSTNVTAVQVQGGGLGSPVSMELYDDDPDDNYQEWDLDIEYGTKAELDTAFPSNAVLTLQLSLSVGGSTNIPFQFGPDNYPEKPYLVVDTFSAVQAADLNEPLKLQWNTASSDATSLEIFTADTDEDVFQDWSVESNPYWIGNDVFEEEEYVGLIDFRLRAPQVDGVVEFATATIFPIVGTNLAVIADDFSDESVTTNAWNVLDSEEGASFEVVDGRLEFTAASSNTASVAWRMDGTSLSSTQDWSVAINVSDYSELSGNQETFAGIAVLPENNAGADAWFSIEFQQDSFGARISSDGGVEEPEVEALEFELALEEEDYEPEVDQDEVILKIFYDADEKSLYGSYSIGGAYDAVHRLDAEIFGLSDSSGFIPAIFAESKGITNAVISFDQFRVHDVEEQVLSNFVEQVEINYLLDYGSDRSAIDDESRLSLEVEVDGFEGTVRAFPFIGDVVELERHEIEDEYEYELIRPLMSPFFAVWDEEWTIEFGFDDGTFQSTKIPFRQKDGGLILLPTVEPLFSSIDLDHDAGTISLSWSVSDHNANLVVVDTEVDDEYRDLILLSDGFVDEQGLADIDGSIGVKQLLNAPLDSGTNRVTFSFNNVLTAYNDDDVPYIAGKLSEAAFVLFMGDSGADLDADNLPDDWELKNFGSISALDAGPDENFDGDEYSNREEFIIGSNPKDGNSGFSMQSEALAAVGAPSGPPQEFRIDFGTTAPAPGGNWNSLASLNPGVPVALKEYNSGGLNTGVTLKSLYPMGSVPVGTGWNGGAPKEWIASVAGDDCLASGDVVEMIIEGLNPQNKYRIEVLAAYGNPYPSGYGFAILDTVLGDGSGLWWPTSTANGTAAGSNVDPFGFNLFNQGWIEANWLVWDEVVPGRHGRSALAGPNDVLLALGSELVNAIRVTEIEEPPPPGFVVSWTPVAGRLYSVLRTDDLGSGFQSLTNGIAFPVNSYTDTVHAVESGGFYRVDIELAP